MMNARHLLALIIFQAGLGLHILPGISAPHPPLDPSQPPGRNFDLGHWYLTLPDEDASPVSHEDLAAGYTHREWFYTGADGAMVFWCPVTGGTTSGSSYPRSELREQIVPGETDENWRGFGTHVLSAQCRVLAVPSTANVIIGQIHSKTGQARPLVKLHYTNSLVAAFVKNSPTAAADTVHVFGPSVLGELIAYELKMINGRVTVAVNGARWSMDAFASDPKWAQQEFYFKAGAYCIDNEGPGSEGAGVAFYDLQVRHSAEAEVPPAMVLQPVGQRVLSGGPASFSVLAAGSPPLAYQWRFNGEDLAGATDATFTRSSVQPAHAGKYSVVVANDAGSVESAPALLRVEAPLTLAQAVDAPLLTWRTGGHAPWKPQTAVTLDGDAAQSGAIGHRQATWLEATITGPGTVTFWWRVSSESRHDRLRFYVNGALKASIAGDKDWRQQTLRLPRGRHELRWSYRKNGVRSRRQDCAWLEQVQFSALP